MNVVEFHQHDHAACRASALAAAERRCKDKGLQLTPVRRRTLEILLAEHRAMGAYEVLDILRDEGFGAQPPVAYRALDFLVTNGFAHRIERLNAFIACSLPGAAHAPVFLICTECGTVAEAHLDLRAGRLGDIADTAGFEIDRAVVEIEGRCPACKAAR